MPSRHIAALIVLLMMAAGIHLDAQTAQSLAQVKKLYVQTFDGGKPAAQLRQELIKRLRKSKYDIVENPTEADAVIHGNGRIWVKGYLTTNWRSPSTNRQAVYGGYLSVEVNGKNGETLWSYLVTPGKLIWSDIINDLAGNMAKEMVEARTEQNAPDTAAHKDSLARTSLSGAGATFPAPLYQKWLQSFQQRYPEVHITYNAIGSEKGVHQLAEHEVDFAGSDVSSPDLGDPHMHRNFRRIASVLGAVVPIYNLSNLSEDLRFTPEILADIYLGKIKKWNDPEIRKVNRGADLPDAEIMVVHRADGSGTTYTWSDFLAKVSPQWKTSVGTGTRLDWPVGVAVEGNEGVAEKVQQTPNSVGYVELVYAIQHQVNYGLVRNSAGEYIRAGLDTLAEAARTSTTSDGTGLPTSITNAPGKGAYPIATFTWLVLPDEIADSAKKAALVELLEWILTEGQKQCSALGYAPLPREIAERELQLVNAIK